MHIIHRTKNIGNIMPINVFSFFAGKCGRKWSQPSVMMRLSLNFNKTSSSIKLWKKFLVCGQTSKFYTKRKILTFELWQLFTYSFSQNEKACLVGYTFFNSSLFFFRGGWSLCRRGCHCSTDYSKKPHFVIGFSTLLYKC